MTHKIHWYTKVLMVLLTTNSSKIRERDCQKNSIFLAAVKVNKKFSPPSIITKVTSNKFSSADIDVD